jgi:hypothetical protein
MVGPFTCSVKHQEREHQKQTAAGTVAVPNVGREARESGKAAGRGDEAARGARVVTQFELLTRRMFCSGLWRAAHCGEITELSLRQEKIKICCEVLCLFGTG